MTTDNQALADRLLAQAQWFDHQADVEPEPDTKASHRECADDCREAAAAMTATPSAALIAEGTEGWRLNRINAGPPFHVETIKYGPQYVHMRESPPQVCDARGTVALSGPASAVFCAGRAQADQLCELANAGMLDRI